MQKFFRLRSSARILVGIGSALGIAMAIAALGASSSVASVHARSVGSRATAHSSSTHLKIAYLSFAVANYYDAPMLAAAKAVASKNNASVTVLDANNSAQTQVNDCETALNGGYQGIITQPILSTDLVPCVKSAIKKGIKVVNIDQILGAKLNTAADQVKGQSGNVTFVPTVMGQDLGKLVVQACQSKKLKPCTVGYMYDVQASSLDIAIRDGFNSAIAGHHVTVTVIGSDEFTPSVAEGLASTFFVAHPKIDVVAGSDQGILGTTDAKNMPKHLLLVGYGGSTNGIAGVKSGKWYGTVLQDPATEGKDGMQTLINAIRKHKTYTGVNPLTSFPSQGLITKSDVSKFKGEWTI